MKPDKNIVIIGGGLGGLVCGAILSKEGYGVTVVEKNAKAGGCLQSYSRFGAIFDTGMHVFGGMNADGNIRRICRYLGIEDSFTTIDFDTDSTAEVFFGQDKERYAVSLSGDRFVDSLSSIFPSQRAGLERYKDAVGRVMEDLDLFHLRSTPRMPVPRSEDFLTPADAFIGKYITDARLRAILASVNILYGGVKGTTPAYLHCAITSIFLNGACRVAGGYSTFADALAGCIKSHGGVIITGDAACAISTSGGSATSVTTASGRRIEADAVISSLPLEAMLSMVDDDRLFSRTYRTIPQKKRDSVSAFIINAKIKPDAMEYSDSIGFYLEGTEAAWSADQGMKAEKIMYMTPPMIGQGRNAETFCAIVPMHWEAVSRWESTTHGRRGDAYHRFKQEMAALAISKLSASLPSLPEAIEAIDTASPLTIRDYTGARRGAMCGYLNDCADPIPFLPVNTRVPNIFLTGQNVNMHGFCGVTLTAVQTCEAIFGRDYLINKLNLL